MTQTLVPLELIQRGFGGKTDFAVMTGAMTPAKRDDGSDLVSANGVPVLSMVGSSTIQDLQGDYMAMSALQDMANVPDNLTIFLNHSYDLPDDVFGGLYGSPAINVSKNIAEVGLKVETELDNPPAAKTFNMIVNKGRRFGCSVGCAVLDWDFDDDDGSVVIKRVYVVEWSVVGIPANQRCWVENAIAGMFQRSLVEGRGDDALKLAPAVKSLFSRDYSRIVDVVSLKSLQSDLSRVQPRGTAPQQFLLWDASQNTFMLKGSHASKILSHDQVNDLLITRAASGKTSWPLADRNTKWDSGEATKDIEAWADGDWSKVAQCFFWSDGTPEKLSDCKLPFVAKVGGEMKAIPQGIISCAGVMQGAMGGAKIPESDVAGVKSKIASYYKKMDMTPPWESEKSGEGVLSSENGGEALIRQDLEDASEEKSYPDAADVSIRDDGTHEPCSGTHTHGHKAYGTQGGDETHEHAHSHDGDAHHGHSHSEEKHMDPKNLGTEETPQHSPEAQEEVVETTENQSVVKSVETPSEPSENDSERMALLLAYNTIGKRLGFEDVSFKQKGDNSFDLQNAISLLSQADACIDQVMQIFGIPDVDKQDTVLMSSSAEFLMIKAYTELLTKSGKELSEKNRTIIGAMHDQAKALHDLAAGMHPGCCNCGGTNESDATSMEDAEANAEAQTQLTNSVESLTRALDKLNIKGIQDDVEAAQAELAKIQQGIANSQQELQSLNNRAAAIKNAPLGRPTTMRRSIAGEANYSEMKAASGQPITSLKEALEQTNLVGTSGAGTMQYRHWPAGVGLGMRPALTPDQKSFMRPDDILSYNDGGDSYVPLIDDPTSL